MPDLTWITDADADTAVTVGLLALCWLVIAVALAIRLADPAGRAARRARRFIGRWLVRAGRWAGRRWDALWLCPACRCDRRTHTRTPRTSGETIR